MIGHYLLTLSPEQEHRVLVKSFAGVNCARADEGCLVMIANPDFGWADAMLTTMYREESDSVACRYDELCERFGENRLNTAIRNRVLGNQVRRTLTAVPVEATI